MLNKLKSGEASRGNGNGHSGGRDAFGHRHRGGSPRAGAQASPRDAARRGDAGPRGPPAPARVCRLTASALCSAAGGRAPEVVK